MLPDMSFAVGLGREWEFANVALKWSLPIVGPHVSNQGALVSTGIAAHVALVGRQAHVHSGVTCRQERTR